MIAAAAVPAASLAITPAVLARAEADAQLIAALLGVQQLEVFAYRRLLASTVLDADGTALLTQLLSLEMRHAEALGAKLVALGGTVGPGPAGVAAADRELAAHPVSGRLSGTRSQHHAVKLLIDLESVAEGACYRAIVKLADPQVARLVAEVMGSEAQQWTLLDQLQHGDVVRAVPGPFVEGSK
jgi:hypothetical protein